MDGVLREVGAFHVHVHGIAVQAGLHAGAILDLAIGRAARAACGDMHPRSTRELERSTGCPHRTAQGAGEIQVARLVVGRVRVGDIGGQHFLPSRPNIQRGLDESEVIVDLAQHDVDSCGA